eukprot:1872681-Amphidinium_carterae.1
MLDVLVLVGMVRCVSPVAEGHHHPRFGNDPSLRSTDGGSVHDPWFDAGKLHKAIQSGRRPRRYYPTQMIIDPKDCQGNKPQRCPTLLFHMLCQGQC